jgi:hypothetical protein
MKIGKSGIETALLILDCGEWPGKKSSVFESHRWFKDRSDMSKIN